MMHIMKKLHCISVALLVFVATSCSTPMSKESYLEKFDAFVSEISKDYKTYSDKEWEKKTEEFEKFSGSWYEKFKDDFTLRENLKITAYTAKFQYYKTLSQSSSAFKELLDIFNVNEWKEKAQSCINTVEADLNHLSEEIIKAGNAAEETLSEIFKDWQVDIEYREEEDDE